MCCLLPVLCGSGFPAFCHLAAIAFLVRISSTALIIGIVDAVPRVEGAVGHGFLSRDRRNLQQRLYSSRWGVYFISRMKENMVFDWIQSRVTARARTGIAPGREEARRAAALVAREGQAMMPIVITTAVVLAVLALAAANDWREERQRDKDKNQAD